MLIDSIALRLVEGYRARLSPRKGWRCAAGVAGQGTCSTVIRDALVADGALRSVVPAARQFATCARSATVLRHADTRVEGVCCCGPIPIPFRF